MSCPPAEDKHPEPSVEIEDPDEGGEEGEPQVEYSATSTTGYVFDPRCLRHACNYDHVERPARIGVTHKFLQSEGLLARVRHVPARLAEREELEGTHSGALVDRVEATETYTYGPGEPDSDEEEVNLLLRVEEVLPEAGEDDDEGREQPPTTTTTSSSSSSSSSSSAIDASSTTTTTSCSSTSTVVEKKKVQRVYNDCVYFDSDTYANEHSYTAARLAAGGLVSLAEQVLGGDVHNGFAVTRPPGHHAEEVKSMGFCLFNTVAVATNALLAKHPRDVKRVLIVDWDVHHGNGTQNLFYESDQVLYFSIHRSQGGVFYPGSGFVKECGRGAGKGFNVNVPLATANLGDEEYLLAWREVLLPIAREFDPSLVIVSAGFDCGRGDPLGGNDVTPECFFHLTRQLMRLNAPMVMTLEGGYNTTTVSRSIGWCIRALLGDEAPLMEHEEQKQQGGGFVQTLSQRQLKKKEANHKAFLDTLKQVKKAQRPHWECMQSQ
jgi:acetoin utilization deacetylase AcuC-like enzyme